MVMEITGNLSNYFDQAGSLLSVKMDKINNALETSEELFVAGEIFSGIRKFVVELINVPRDFFELTVEHFPKTTFIAIIVDAIASAVLGYYFSMAISVYCFYKYDDFIRKTIDEYDSRGISEWTCPPEVKQHVIIQIHAKMIMSSVVNGCVHWFSQVLHNARDFFWRTRST